MKNEYFIYRVGGVVFGLWALLGLGVKNESI